MTQQHELTDTEADAALQKILAGRGAGVCPQCGRTLGLGDVAWNNGSTEAGTPGCFIEIQCGACETEIRHIWSWYPWIDGYQDLLDVIERDWRDGFV